MPGQPKQKARGRPTLPADQRRTVAVKILLTEAEAEKYEALGGRHWMRAALQRARKPG